MSDANLKILPKMALCPQILFFPNLSFLGGEDPT